MREKADWNKPPTHHAYFLKKVEPNKARWLELGPAWAHQDGKGFEMLLETLPVGGFNGRIIVRAIDAKPPREMLVAAETEA
jgi:hypothetical protein